MILNLKWFRGVYRINFQTPSFDVPQVKLNAEQVHGDRESSLMDASRVYRCGRPGTGSKSKSIQRFRNCEANKLRLE
jgi:hypothetical protein